MTVRYFLSILLLFFSLSSTYSQDYSELEAISKQTLHLYNDTSNSGVPIIFNLGDSLRELPNLFHPYKLSKLQFLVVPVRLKLGLHNEKAQALVAYNDSTKHGLFVPPLTHFGMSQGFLQLFIGIEIKSKQECVQFAFAIKKLLQIMNESNVYSDPYWLQGKETITIQSFSISRDNLKTSNGSYFIRFKKGMIADIRYGFLNIGN